MKIWHPFTPQSFMVCFLKTHAILLLSTCNCQNQEITINIALTVYRPCSVLPIISKMFFVAKENSVKCLAFSCPVSLVSYSLQHFLSLYLLWSWYFWRIQTQDLVCFVRMSFIFSFSDNSSWLSSGFVWLAGILQKRCCVLLSALYQEAHDNNLSHYRWIYLLFAKFVFSKITISLLILSVLQGKSLSLYISCYSTNSDLLVWAFLYYCFCLSKLWWWRFRILHFPLLLLSPCTNLSPNGVTWKWCFWLPLHQITDAFKPLS